MLMDRRKRRSRCSNRLLVCRTVSGCSGYVSRYIRRERETITPGISFFMVPFLAIRSSFSLMATRVSFSRESLEVVCDYRPGGQGGMIASAYCGHHASSVMPHSDFLSA